MINPFDESFIKQISNDLVGFKKSNNNYNFRCPYCGDSAKSVRKQRGWLIDYKGTTFFKCFNCDKAISFKYFLKDMNETVYKSYLMAKNSGSSKVYNNSYVITKEKTEAVKYTDFIGNKFIFNCGKLNNGSIYLRSRHLTHPEMFYYTDDYGSLLESLNLTDYKIEWCNHEERLVIPHWDKMNELMFLQFRNLDPNAKVRYKTYRIKEDVPKIWGLDRIDWNKKVFVVEGALDASLLDNCIAMSGSDVDTNNIYINNYKDKLYFILDNEPYNKVICDKYKKLYERGFNVFIWPNTDAKDINDYYMENGDLDIFKDMNRFYKGLKLKLELARWIKS